MKTITKKQFDILTTHYKSNLQSLPEHILADIDSMRALSKYNKAYLILTHPEDQDKYFLDYIDINNIKPREMYETELHAKVNRGCVVAL